jgi:hypothetical protein
VGNAQCGAFAHVHPSNPAQTAQTPLDLPAGDKLYEKRKLGALEVEQIVKRLAQQNDYHRIRLIIDKVPAVDLSGFSPIQQQQMTRHTATITP